MKIVIPMSGFGERFRKAGYRVPKPLIEVEGKPIIAHVIDLFPGELDFVFVCNSEHLQERSYQLAETLGRYCPTGAIVEVAPHRLGPMHAVRHAYPLIRPDEPVIINYCDFTCYWNYNDFKRFLKETECDGCIPAYRGFHPHMLGTTNYAFLKETGGWVQDIQEKRPFTQNRMNEYASSGTYYFRSGSLLKSCADEAFSAELHTNGEFYTSLAYKPLFDRGGRVAVYELSHFMQWGTPHDLEEYLRWSRIFRERRESAQTIQFKSDDERRTFRYWQSCFSKWDGHPYTLESDRALTPNERQQLRTEFTEQPPRRPEARPTSSSAIEYA